VKVYDFKCIRCPIIEERFVKQHDDAQECRCGAPMVKLPPATPTTFRFADKRT
jgi:hypothetical protein